jgi:hypothetical protein
MLNLKFLEQNEFRRQLQVEEKRAERSGTSFILILLETAGALQSGPVREQVLEALRDSVRDTDICGWFTENAAAGIIFTEVTRGDAMAIGPALVADVKLRLQALLTSTELEDVSFSIHPQAAPPNANTLPARQIPSRLS